MLKNKKLTLLSIFLSLFVALQIFAASHNINHSFNDKHASDSQCSIFALSKNLSSPDFNVDLAPDFVKYELALELKESQFSFKSFQTSHSSRSPPVTTIS